MSPRTKHQTGAGPIRRTVLILPAGTEVGLEIQRSLAGSKFWDVIGANSLRDHSEVTYHDVRFGLPFASDADFVEKALALIDQVRPDFVFPAHDEVIYALAGADLGGAR